VSVGRVPLRVGTDRVSVDRVSLQAGTDLMPIDRDPLQADIGPVSIGICHVQGDIGSQNTCHFTGSVGQVCVHWRSLIQPPAIALGAMRTMAAT